MQYTPCRHKTIGVLKGMVIRARRANKMDQDEEEVSTIAVTSESEMSMEAWYSYPLQFDSDSESHEAWVKQTGALQIIIAACVTITIAAEQMPDAQGDPEDEQHKFERHLRSLQRGSAKATEAMYLLDCISLCARSSRYQKPSVHVMENDEMVRAAEAMNPFDCMN